MAIKILHGDKINWYNIDEPNETTLNYLRENFKFHPLDFKDVLGTVEQPKIDIYNNYLFLIFHFPEFNKELHQIKAREIDTFLGKDYLVTIQKEKFKPLSQCFYRCLKNPKVKYDFFKGDSGYLLYKVLDYLFINVLPITDIIGHQIDQLEQNIYSEEKVKNIIKDLAITRRNILYLRRIIDPQRVVIKLLTKVKKDFLSDESSIYFDDISDYIEKIWVILESYKGISQTLFETRESLMTQRTNEVIKMLTIFSVALMPLTLLASIYGMNITGLPFSNAPFFVWLLFGSMILFIGLIIAYFKKREWL